MCHFTAWLARLTSIGDTIASVNMHADETGIIVATGRGRKKKKISFIQWVDTNRDSSIYSRPLEHPFPHFFFERRFLFAILSFSLFFLVDIFLFSPALFIFSLVELVKKKGNRSINLSFICKEIREKILNIYLSGCVYIYTLFEGDLFKFYALRNNRLGERVKWKCLILSSETTFSFFLNPNIYSIVRKNLTKLLYFENFEVSSYIATIEVCHWLSPPLLPSDLRNTSGQLDSHLALQSNANFLSR